MIYLGMDVHKDSIRIAVLPQTAKAPTRLERLPNDLPKLKKWLDRVAREGEVHACCEASGAGYVLHRALRDWGYACEVIAPSLIPKRSGVHRKHDKRDAADLARLYRAGELVPVRIPSEADERVRDVVRCRETFQREILKSRHYILKFRDARVRVSGGDELVHAAPAVAATPHHGHLTARARGSPGVSGVPRVAPVQAAATRGA
jgi:transposase